MKTTCLLLLTMIWATLMQGIGYATPELVPSQPQRSGSHAGRSSMENLETPGRVKNVETPGGVKNVETPGPLPWGQGVPRPAFSPAGAGRVRGHSGPASQKANRPKQLPNGRQRSLPGNAMNLHQPRSHKSGGAAKSGFIRNETVNNASAVRTLGVVRPAVPSPNHLHQRSPNPAVVGSSPPSHRSNTGAINGTRMNRKP